MMEGLARRRTIVMDRLAGASNISCVAPEGAFYAFPRLHIDVDDATFCADLMRATGVVVVPGSGFGQRDGTRHLRIVFLPPEDVLAEACDMIAEFAASYG